MVTGLVRFGSVALTFTVAALMVPEPPRVPPLLTVVLEVIHFGADLHPVLGVAGAAQSAFGPMAGGGRIDYSVRGQRRSSLVAATEGAFVRTGPPVGESTTML